MNMECGLGEGNKSELFSQLLNHKDPVSVIPSFAYLMLGRQSKPERKVSPFLQGVPWEWGPS